jgi:hypothetical protein
MQPEGDPKNQQITSPHPPTKAGGLPKIFIQQHFFELLPGSCRESKNNRRALVNGKEGLPATVSI